MLPHLTKPPIGQPFIEIPELDSTNIYAIDQIKAKLAAHGTLYFAHHQTAGKGQHGKKWLGEPGKNIAISAIINPFPLELSQQFHLSVMTALAVHDFFSRYTRGDCSIKWPNDIFWGDRKAGGILIENLIRGTHWQWAVLGIGLNINQTQFEPMQKNPVSLKQITGKEWDLIALAKELALCLENRYLAFMNGGFESMLQEYNQYLYKKGAMVEFRQQNRRFTAQVIEVNSLGELVLNTGMEENFPFGQLEWLLEP